MFDSLDSRALRRTDCYAQRFMKPGVYAYNVLPVHGDSVTQERPFTVRVTERKKDGPMRQSQVAVVPLASGFGADPGEVVIEAGDLVLWSLIAASKVPYCVVGEKEFLASHRMVNESGYTHAFGVAGEYRWVDAHGSGAHGVVRVKDPRCKDQGDFKRWHKSLSTGTVVTITDGVADPREVEIATGQTVFFAVTKGPGLSITDERLVPRAQVASKTTPGTRQPTKTNP